MTQKNTHPEPKMPAGRWERRISAAAGANANRRYPRQEHDIEKLKSLRMSGLKVSEIAKAQNLRVGTVYRALKDAGCSPSRRQMTWARWGDLGDLVSQLKEASGSWQVVAKNHGIDPFSFRAYLHSKGITCSAPRSSGYVAWRCTDEHNEEIIELRKKGETLGNISRRFRISLQRVKNICGVIELSVFEARWRKMGDIGDLQDRINKAGSIKDLAKELNISPGTLARKMKQEGVKSPFGKHLWRGSINKEWTLKRYRQGSRIKYLAERQDVEPRRIKKFLIENGETITTAASRGHIAPRKTAHSDDHKKKMILGRTSEPFCLDEYKNYQKLRFLLKALSSMERYRPRLAAERKEFVDKFYYDSAFSALFCNWCANKISDSVPSLDHLHPVGRGGTHELDNLQYITWWENRVKSGRTLSEWKEFQQTFGLRCELLTSRILHQHRNCRCQQLID